MTSPDLTPSAARRAVEGLRPASDGAIEAYARAIWSVVTEPGDGTAGALIAAYGPEEALRRAMGDADPQLAEARSRWLPRLRSAAVTAALDSARRAGAALVVPGDPGWPGAVDDLGAHAPIVLWRRGGGEVPSVPAVALVGARASTAYGEGVAADLAADLAAEGLTVVSGAAYGIDGAAHRAALTTSGRTIAFLAGGVDRAYPRGHGALLDRIAGSGGVWSETPCGSAPTKWRFLSRNRLIAAMADAVVVVEAGWRSGSLNTAAHAATLGRALGAVPGPVTSAASAGCHRILREFDGVCVTSAADVLEMIGRAPGAAVPDAGRTDDTTRLVDALSTRAARSTEEVARRSGLAPAHAAALLGFAELEGRAERDEDGSWRSVRRAEGRGEG